MRKFSTLYKDRGKKVEDIVVDVRFLKSVQQGGKSYAPFPFCITKPGWHTGANFVLDGARENHLDIKVVVEWSFAG